jgi:hypothetical protein
LLARGARCEGLGPIADSASCAAFQHGSGIRAWG